MASWKDAPIVAAAEPRWKSAPQIADQAQMQALRTYLDEHGIPGLGNLAFADQAVEAVPIAGPWLKEQMQNLRGGLASGIEGLGDLTGLYDYKAPSREDMDAFTAASVKGSPEAALAGQVFGTVAPLAVAGVPAMGARLLGMSGNLASRIGFGLGSGGVISGADTLTRGGDLDEAQGHALLGAAIGGGLPIAGRVGSKVLQALMGKAIAPAEATLARAFRDDKINPETVAQRLDEIGPGAVIADLGPNLQSQAAALASTPGRAQQIVREAFEARKAGATGRIAADLDATMGSRPVPSRVDAEIRANQKELSPEYEAALKGAPLGHDAAEDMISSLNFLIHSAKGPSQTALRKVRKMMHYVLPAAGDVPETLHPDPFPRDWLRVRHEIDGMLDGETNRTVRGVLTDFRKRLDEAIMLHVPGIKEIDDKFAELARQRKAVERGQEMLDSGRTAPRPVEVADEMTQGAIPQGRLIGPSAVPFRLSQGALAEIDRIIGTNINDVTAMKRIIMGEGDWNRARLVSLFGDRKAAALIRILEREKRFAGTDARVLDNSETARRLASQKEMSQEVTGMPTNTTLTGIVGNILTRGAAAGIRANKEGTNSAIAQALVSSAGRVDPEAMSAVAKAIAQQLRRGYIPPAAVPLLVN